MNINRSSRFYTLEEVTEMLGVSEQEIMNMITLKKLPAVKIEQSIQIKEEDIERFLDSLGKNDVEDENAPKVKAGTEVQSEVADSAQGKGINQTGYMVKEGLEDNIIELAKSYRGLLRKKQELEEDINYLQCKYDEFKSRIRKIISEEFNLFLKKIDEEDLQISEGIMENDFNDDLGIDNDIDTIEDDEGEGYNNKEKTFPKDNGGMTENLISKRDNKIELLEDGNDD